MKKYIVNSTEKNFMMKTVPYEFQLAQKQFFIK